MKMVGGTGIIGQDWICEFGKEKYLYKNGDECTSITGGWIKGGYNRGTNGTITKEENCMVLFCPQNNKKNTITISTNNRINLKNKKIYIDLEVDYTGNIQNKGLASILLDSSNSIYSYGDNIPYLKRKIEKGKQLIECIPNIEEGYVQICCDLWTSSDTSLEVKIYKVYVK
ncbi:MAG: hypothetical protein ACI33J_03405 [Clostridium sp.]